MMAYPVQGSIEYFLALSGLWMATFLSVNEIKLAGLGMYLQRMEIDHPLTSLRIYKVLIAIVIIALTLPPAILYTRWPEFYGNSVSTPEIDDWRHAIRIAQFAQFPILWAASLLNALASRPIEERLKGPPRFISWQDRAQVRRVLLISVCTFAIAAGLAWPKV